ncbi:dihydroorotate dehydrogenase (fumarate) [Agromyces sp. CF514]|uniref:hypothetical protein n=1 Tax=Agromyces sp. CF514 TaxID=1881031 RepID=UPI0008E58AC1|nr:hypothetical protein [Agromyces sp. CF514]SFR82626.1 dihydroorotate dehydrogenase (fumarate) [Agromyces sp. CF514]
MQSPTRARTGSIRAVEALARALAVVALAAATVLVGATPAHADDSVGISARPAAADGSSDARTRFEYLADPGQRVEDHFSVTNTGTAAQTFTVLGTDAFNDSDGDFALLPTVEEPTLAGTWIRFENGANRIQFDLGPGETRLLPFSLELPAEATPGDHVGGLVASVVTPGEQVTLDRRVATRLYVRVSGQLQPALNVSGIGGEHVGDWWNPFAGALTLHYVVKNTGNIAVAANSSTTIDTWFGITAAPQIGGGVSEILPGQEAEIEVDVPGVAQWGYLNAAVRLNPFVDSTDPSMQLTVAPSTRDAIVIAPPWALLLAIALVVAVVFLIRRRRRQDDQRAREWMAYTEQEAARKAQDQRDAELAGAGRAAGS